VKAATSLRCVAALQTLRGAEMGGSKVIQDGKLPSGEILLIGQVLVANDEQIKSGILRDPQ
jgi:hypothetical protein